MEVTFKIKIKNCPEIFIEGEEPGIFAVQTVDYKVTENEASSPMFIKELLDRKQQLLEDHVEVLIEKE